jgi:hypothetical protein
MRWAEGHTHNVRNWFFPIMGSRFVTPLEKLEFIYDSTYYLQAGLFVLGTLSWLMSELVFHAHVPGWTALLGWSLLFSNIFALPLMNLGGLILEDAPRRDMRGVLGALALSFALVPFQAWAAFKGLVSKNEGPWFRTPKTGHITNQVHHLRRLHLLRRWLLGPRGRRQQQRTPPARPVGAAVTRITARRPGRWVGWAVAIVLFAAFGGMALLASHAPVVHAAGNPLYLHGSGTAPGCAPATMDQTVGSRAATCRLAGDIGVWSFSNLPAQTVGAGTWSFTMYWAGGGAGSSSTITLSAGVAAGASCAGFVATIPNVGSTWTTTFGLAGVHKTSPFTLDTSASQLPLVIPPGGSLCLRADVSQGNGNGGNIDLVYDGAVGTGDTRLVPPSIVVPESVLGFAGLALLIPVFTQRRRLLAFVRARS